MGWAEDKDHQQSLQDKDVHGASVNLLFLNSIYRCLHPWELKRQKENNKLDFHYVQLWDKSLEWMIRWSVYSTFKITLNRTSRQVLVLCSILHLARNLICGLKIVTHKKLRPQQEEFTPDTLHHHSQLFCGSEKRLPNNMHSARKKMSTRHSKLFYLACIWKQALPPTRKLWQERLIHSRLAWLTGKVSTQRSFPPHDLCFLFLIM